MYVLTLNVQNITILGNDIRFVLLLWLYQMPVKSGYTDQSALSLITKVIQGVLTPN